MIAPVLAGLLGACGDDACEELCRRTTSRLATCLDEWPASWEDLDAESRSEFQRTCEVRWSVVRSDLEPRELDDALEQCEESNAALVEMGQRGTTCDQLRSVYLGPE